ncbi:unnamed protein product [Effrenium voratum]|nr:unnamed protein product [Effrenium voratum]
MVGHTHEDVDAMLSLVTSSVKAESTLVLIMLGIVSFCDELQLTAAQLSEPQLVATLKSFRWVKLGFVTSEKVAPSPVQIVADIRQAIELEKRQLRNGRLALKDALGRVIAEYNKMITAKKHRIDAIKRALIYNMPLG